MDTYDVGDSPTITATWYVDDANGDPIPTSPDTVTLRIRRPDGTIDTPNAAESEPGTFAYALSLTAVGQWRWEFTGVGTADGVQGGSLRCRASIIDQDSPATFVTPDDVEIALGHEMGIDEFERADQLVTQLVRLMERKLNRDLYARTVTERVIVPNMGEPLLARGPVASITAINYSVDSASVAFDDLDPWYGLWPGSDLMVTYTTDPDTAGELDDVRAVIVDTVVRTLLMPAVAASGAIKSYAVEGTSITYGSAGAGSQEGRFTAGDMSGIMRLKRRVYLEVGGPALGGISGVRTWL